jgi:hypothetical protein
VCAEVTLSAQQRNATTSAIEANFSAQYSTHTNIGYGLVERTTNGTFTAAGKYPKK